MFDNGGEGFAADTAATPTTPRGITLRAVRQVVTIAESKEKKEDVVREIVKSGAKTRYKNYNDR